MIIAAAPPDFRRAWTCGSRAEFDGNMTSVIRTLDDKGKQLDLSVQWNVSPERPFTATVSGMIDANGEADPPLRSGLVMLWWGGRVADGADRSSPVVVLHAEGTAPRRADGKPLIERSELSFSGEVAWSRLAALLRSGERAKASLVNGKGEVISSSTVELRQVRRALAAVEEQLAETRWQMRDFEERCEPVTEHLTF